MSYGTLKPSMKMAGVPLRAQWLGHRTANLEVMGPNSTPTCIYGLFPKVEFPMAK